MAATPFYWDDLLEFVVEGRNVIPVVGRDLLVVGEGGGPVRFDTLLAHRLVEFLPDLEPCDDLAAAIAAQLQRSGRKIDLTRVLKRAHDELVARVAVPEPLRQLAEIRDFRLFLSATTDGLLARALHEERGVEPRILGAGTNASDDLALDWEASEQPTLFHLFGRIAATPGFALTEEDMLEFVWTHQTPERRPPRLFDVLRKSHVLLLGNSFPDWFTRFFLRLMKGCRLSEQPETIEALADEGTRGRHEATLVTFLERFSPQTRVYEEGGAVEFVRELHARWQARNTPAQATPGQYEPDDIVAGSVFISYTRPDYEVAERLWRALDRAGIDAWFDRRRLRGGDPFEEKIRRHINQCDLFLPLVSQYTEARDEGFVFKEWTWAVRRAEGMMRTFIVPLNLDGLDPYRCEHVPQFLREANFFSLARTGPAPEIVEQLRHKLREIRALRAA